MANAMCGVLHTFMCMLYILHIYALCSLCRCSRSSVYLVFFSHSLCLSLLLRLCRFYCFSFGHKYFFLFFFLFFVLYRLFDAVVSTYPPMHLTLRCLTLSLFLSFINFSVRIENICVQLYIVYMRGVLVYVYVCIITHHKKIKERQSPTAVPATTHTFTTCIHTRIAFHPSTHTLRKLNRIKHYHYNSIRIRVLVIVHSASSRLHRLQLSSCCCNDLFIIVTGSRGSILPFSADFQMVFVLTCRKIANRKNFRLYTLHSLTNAHTQPPQMYMETEKFGHNKDEKNLV